MILYYYEFKSKITFFCGGGGEGVGLELVNFFLQESKFKKKNDWGGGGGH